MQTVLNFIAQIGEWLTPSLLTGYGVYTIVSVMYKKWQNRKQNKRWDIITNLLEQLVAKNTCEEDVKTLAKELEKVGVEIKDLKDSLKNDEAVTHDQATTLGQMIGVIFENSTLPIETKERLRTLKTKIEYASDAKVVEDLISENSKLKKQVKKLSTDLEKHNTLKIVQNNEADTVTEPEVKESHIVIQ